MNNKYPSTSKLTRYLNGELSAQESDEVRGWFDQSDEGRKELDQLEIIWGLADRLNQMEKINNEKARTKIDSRITSPERSWQIFRQSFQKIAAILIIPVLILSAYLFFQNGRNQLAEQEFLATYGTRSTLTLPDGSKVWLNSGSKLKYGKDFNQNSRTVFLAGEAFFDVAASRFKPFDVVTGRFTVRAVGTEFNVFSYEDDEFETSLEEGNTEIFLSQNKDTEELDLQT